MRVSVRGPVTLLFLPRFLHSPGFHPSPLFLHRAASSSSRLLPPFLKPQPCSPKRSSQRPSHPNRYPKYHLPAPILSFLLLRLWKSCHQAESFPEVSQIRQRRPREMAALSAFPLLSLFVLLGLLHQMLKLVKSVLLDLLFSKLFA